MRILVYSCIREVDRIGVRERRQSCAARPQEEGTHAVSKFRKAVSVGNAVKDSERCNIAAEIQSLKRVGERRGINETKSFGPYSI